MIQRIRRLIARSLALLLTLLTLGRLQVNASGDIGFHGRLDVNVEQATTPPETTTT